MTARDRLFYKLPKQENTIDNSASSQKDDIIKYVNENIIGSGKIFSGPFGLRNALYLDYTASGRSLTFIEDYIRSEVLPEYGNTHTTTSVTSLQTTLYRHEARDIVRNAVHASEHDAVIFVGSGSTGAIHKLIHNLQLDHQPVVFVSPYEHHSSLLPWMEIGAKVIRVKARVDGLVDIQHLQSLLQQWQVTGRQMIGCFSAASNVTGILVDVDLINVMLHKHSALAFWDYASAAPYVKIDMNPVSTGSEHAEQPYLYKDAVFISCHKFVGGVQTPGVLVAKKSLFRNPVPDACGGGTVFFVRREGRRYLKEPELKEEGGTPAIVETIRAGLVFQLKEAVTADVIMEREDYMLRRAREAWQDVPNLVLLGNQQVPKLPIFSFKIYHSESGRFLHHNYVSSLLNDVFGIQARGGCACAGPYAMDLLGMQEDVSKKFEELLAEDSRLDRTHLRRYREYSQREILRPGFTRINLPYFLDEDSLNFALEAVKLVAEHGWKLLPQYMFNPETGEWRQKDFQVFKERKWLGHISYSSGQMTYRQPTPVIKGPLPDNYQDCLQKARDLFSQAEKMKYQLADHTLMFDDLAKPLRWFVLPSEAAACFHGNHLQTPPNLPFCPPQVRELLGYSPFIEEYSDSDVSEADMIGRVKYPSDLTNNIRLISSGVERKGGYGEVPSGQKCERESGSIAGKQHLPETPLHNKTSMVNVSKHKTCIDSCAMPGEPLLMKNDLDHNAAGDNEKFDADNMSDPNGIVCTKLAEDSNIMSNDDGILDASKTSELTVIQEVGRENIADGETRADTDNVIKGSNNVDTVNSCEINVASTVSENRGTKRAVLPSGDNGNVALVSTKKVKDLEKNLDSKEDRSGKQKKKVGLKWYAPPKSIFAPFLKAMDEYNMIQDGDKVLVCLSGGKDSLSLLHTTRQYQFYCRKKKVNFCIGAVTVDPQTPSYDPSPLKQYLASLAVPYFYESQCIMEQAQNLPYECASICSFCSRMKRGRIYACARREGYNVLALGQHLDDLCESFVMSIFHNGNLRTMKAHYTVQEGDLRVIRPLVYVREKDLRTFAETSKLPVISENCPACFEAPKERHRIKQLLASQEIMFPRIFPSLASAIKPIMAINKTQMKAADFFKAGNESEDDMDI